MTKSDLASRMSSLRERMSQSKTDLLVLAPGPHMTWLLGFSPHPDERPCLLLIGSEKEAFLMPSLNAEETRKHTSIAFYQWSDDQGPASALSKAIADIGARGARSVVLDETMRADFALLLLDTVPAPQRRFTFDTLGSLRMRKDTSEYEALKENALINDRAMKAGLAALKKGKTEVEIAEVIQSHYPQEGASSFFSIIAAGPNSAYPHHKTSDHAFEKNEVVLLDIGGKKGGFYSDMTRMAVIGEPPEGYKKIHLIVESAVQNALKAARPGVLASEVDMAARNTISEAGYGKYFVHRTGHGMGLEIHEPPYITSKSETVLEPGMVFSIEPGIYLPGRFGIRLEEIVILREDGPEILSELPRDLFVS